MLNEPRPHSSRAAFPQGLLGETRQFLLDAAHYPNETIAQAGAIAIVAGVTGRAFNTPTGAGLNQYVLLLANTGLGKDIVASGYSRLIAAVAPKVPAVVDFKGPGELASAPALIKSLERKPCFLSISGEFGKKFEEMTNSKAIHAQALYRTALQMYSKSGAGEVFDPIAYSDKDKNTAAIKSPSLSIFGESVPDTFYGALGEGNVTDGLMSRFMVFETTDKRSYRSPKADDYQPNRNFVERWERLATHSLGLAHRGVVHRVEGSPEAKARFDEFERWTTDEINRATGDGSRQLWNRAYLKALKLASLAAVGEDYTNPQITLSHTLWAIELVTGQTNALIARFTKGDVGAVAGNEVKQREHVLKIIAKYSCDKDPDPTEFYLHRSGVITKSHIQQRTSRLAAFQPKPTQALNALLKSMEEADEINQLTNKEMVEKFGTRAKAYAMRQPHLLKPYLDA